jgi:hypothetical protein
MEQWSLAGSAIVSRIIPVLQHSITPPLRLVSTTDYFRSRSALVFAFRPMFGF